MQTHSGIASGKDAGIDRRSRNLQASVLAIAKVCKDFPHAVQRSAGIKVRNVAQRASKDPGPIRVVTLIAERDCGFREPVAERYAADSAKVVGLYVIDDKSPSKR